MSRLPIRPDRTEMVDWAQNTPSVTSRFNRSVTASLNHCFHASVQVPPSLSQKLTKYNISPKSVYHGSPKQSFEPFLPSEACEQRFIKMRLCDRMN